MKKQTFKRLAALFLALTLALPGAVSAEEAPTASTNINKQDYATYGSTVTSYLYENGSGLTRVEYTGGKVVVEDYDSSYHMTASRTISPELPVWGGFFAGRDANYLIFGQRNMSESSSAEVIRAVKYSKDWQKQGSTSIVGAYTQIPFSSGSLRCAEENGYLYIHCARQMVKQFMTMYGPMSDGLNHQTNLLIEIRESDMQLSDIYDQVWNLDFGYVSHAFNQFIVIDQDKNIVTLNHSDSNSDANGKYHGGVAQPVTSRGIDLIRYDEKAGQERFRGKNQWQWTTFSLVQAFGGSSGNNVTGASIGGFEETSSSYVCAYNYDGRGTSYTTPRDIYLGVTSKSGLQSTAAKISTVSGVTTPQMVSTGLNGGWVLWNGKSGYSANDTLYYTAYTASGASGSVMTANAPLSDCQPIYHQGKAVWYVTNNSAPTFYGLDASGVTVLGGADPTAPSAPSTPDTPSAPSGPDTPSAPTTPAVPANPTNPTNPSNPTNPTNPSKPSSSTAPTTPSTPDTPSEPDSPGTPGPNLPEVAVPSGVRYQPGTFGVHDNNHYMDEIVVTSCYPRNDIVTMNLSDASGKKLANNQSSLTNLPAGSTATVRSGFHPNYGSSLEVLLCNAVFPKQYTVDIRFTGKTASLTSGTVLNGSFNGCNMFAMKGGGDNSYYFFYLESGGSAAQSSGTAAPGGSTPSTTAPSTTTPSAPAAGTGSSKEASFADVPKSADYWYAVNWAVREGVTTGVTPTEFRPNATCTRGQVATFLWRSKGCPEPKTKTNPFRDVSPSSPFYKAILWAYENGITTGTSATTFNPGGTCTEGHILTFIWRADGELDFGPSGNRYANDGKFYSKAVAWADGIGDGGILPSDYNPYALASRSSVVTWLYMTN